MKRLGKCFWRFDGVEPALDSALQSLRDVMERKRRQFSLYVRQVQGQFELAAERVAR